MLHRMPTQNPRLSITLTPEVAAVLRELAELTGNSQSATVGELLQMSLPVFERVAAGIRAAKEIQASARAEIAEGLERAQARVEEQLGIAMADLDEGFRPSLEQAEKVRRRAGRQTGVAGAGPARLPADPRPVTRGSGAHGGAGKTRKKAARRGRV